MRHAGALFRSRHRGVSGELQEENSQSENTDSMQDGVADSPKETDPEEESQGVGLCMGEM